MLNKSSVYATDKIYAQIGNKQSKYKLTGAVLVSPPTFDKPVLQTQLRCQALQWKTIKYHDDFIYQHEIQTWLKKLGRKNNLNWLTMIANYFVKIHYVGQKYVAIDVRMPNRKSRNARDSRNDGGQTSTDKVVRTLN